MATWKLETAKARLSELVRSAQSDGPQEITVRGRPAVLVSAVRLDSQPTAESPGAWVQRLRDAAGPEGLDFDIEREPDDGHRDIVW